FVIIFLTLIVAPVLLRWPARRKYLRRLRGECSACGYSLHTNVSGRCPECGKPIGEEIDRQEQSTRGCKVRRVFISLVTTLSLVMCVAAAVMWVRSYWQRWMSSNSRNKTSCRSLTVCRNSVTPRRLSTRAMGAL